MCVKEWKRIAEWEAVHYRERKAFLRGMEDAGCAMTERAAQYKRWVDAVERVLFYLERYAPEKGRFFRQCYGIDGDRKLYEVRTRKIICISNALASAGNIAYAAATENWKKLDVGGILVTLYRLFTDINFMTRVKKEFIEHEMDKVLEKEIKELDSYFE